MKLRDTETCEGIQRKCDNGGEFEIWTCWLAAFSVQSGVKGKYQKAEPETTVHSEKKKKIANSINESFNVPEEILKIL